MTVLEEGVRELLEEYVDVPTDAFSPLTLEPLTLVEVVQELAERFGVKTEAATAENLRSVSAIVAFVNKHRVV